jgi:hypothetical protein
MRFQHQRIIYKYRPYNICLPLTIFYFPELMAALLWHNDWYDPYAHYGIGGLFMGRSVSGVEARQKLGEILNRVALRQEEIFFSENAVRPILQMTRIGSDLRKCKFF